jgi:hypothetical protein
MLIMKFKYIYILPVVLLLRLLTGCDESFLDVAPTDRINDESLKSSATLFEGYVVNRYMSIRYTEKEGEGTPPGFGRGFEYAMWSSLTDESVYIHDDYSWIIQQGALAPNNTGIAGTLWARSYRSIRECNYALSIIDEVDMEDDHREILRAELKFIRAYRYHDLIRNYGKVVLLGDRVSNLNDDFSDPSLYEKSEISECINYVVNQLNEAAAALPVNNNSQWPLGRATKGAALALKARMLLYAASPLYNAGTWKDAADAARDVMDMNKYQLYGDYGSLFLDENSNEIIFERLYAVGSNHVCMEIANGPNGYSGWAGNVPLQNLIDDYEVLVDQETAVPFDTTNPAHVNNPYENRDPRFYATILYNGAEYRGRPVETFLPGGKDTKDGIDNWNTSFSGYYLRKFIDETLPIVNPWDVAGTQPWIYMRYAEILLNFAEARNEDTGPDAEVYAAINAIRDRAGMPDLPEVLTKNEMREKIWHERRIELAFEEHRFYDVRRWQIAMETENEPAYGMRINKINDTTFTYERIIALDGRRFEIQHYWLPIPLEEIQSSGGLLEQNPDY